MFGSFGSTGAEEAVAPRRHEPVRVDDPVHRRRPRRAAERRVVLRPAVDVVERLRLVQRHPVELRDGEVRLELPRRPAVPALVDAAVVPVDEVARVGRVDPERVVVDVLVLLAQPLPRLPAVLGHHVEDVHRVDAVDVLRVGDHLLVVLRPRRRVVPHAREALAAGRSTGTSRGPSGRSPRSSRRRRPGPQARRRGRSARGPPWGSPSPASATSRRRPSSSRWPTPARRPPSPRRAAAAGTTSRRGRSGRAGPSRGRKPPCSPRSKGRPSTSSRRPSSCRRPGRPRPPRAAPARRHRRRRSSSGRRRSSRCAPTTSALCSSSSSRRPATGRRRRRTRRFAASCSPPSPPRSRSGSAGRP